MTDTDDLHDRVRAVLAADGIHAGNELLRLLDARIAELEARDRRWSETMHSVLAAGSVGAIGPGDVRGWDLQWTAENGWGLTDD